MKTLKYVALCGFLVVSNHALATVIDTWNQEGIVYQTPSAGIVTTAKPTGTIGDRTLFMDADMDFGNSLVIMSGMFIHNGFIPKGFDLSYGLYQDANGDTVGNALNAQIDGNRFAFEFDSDFDDRTIPAVSDVSINLISGFGTNNYVNETAAVAVSADGKYNINFSEYENINFSDIDSIVLSMTDLPFGADMTFKGPFKSEVPLPAALWLFAPIAMTLLRIKKRPSQA